MVYRKIGQLELLGPGRREGITAYPVPVVQGGATFSEVDIGSVQDIITNIQGTAPQVWLDGLVLASIVRACCGLNIIVPVHDARCRLNNHSKKSVNGATQDRCVCNIFFLCMIVFRGGPFPIRRLRAPVGG